MGAAHSTSITAIVSGTVAAAELPRRTGYLPFVDGLRAVAILGVVAFHVGVPGISGGYLGVDVFFVISGFLILGHTHRDLDRGTFSLGGFFARRTLRIFPALAAVIVATILLAFAFPVTPPEIKEMWKSGDASALFWANIYFFKEIDYFAIEAEARPFLHIWSLGVEEQFYLFVAFLGAAIVLTRRAADRAGLFDVLCLVVLVASFAGVIASRFLDHPYAAFYLAPFRGWELIAGGVAARLAERSPDWLLRYRRALVACGYVLVGAAIALAPRAAAFPDWAIPAVMGTFLILAAGAAKGQQSVPFPLGLRPLPFIGRVSYAWYLWHWPMLFLFSRPFFGQQDLYRNLAAAAAAFALAVLTYVLIERPVLVLRNWQRTRGMNWSIVAAGLASLLVVVALNHSLAALWTLLQDPVLVSTYDRAKQRVWQGCPERTIGDATFCVFGDGDPDVLIWGDSHAMHLGEMAEQLARRNGITVAVAGFRSCSAFLDATRSLGEEDDCENFRGRVLQLLNGGDLAKVRAVIAAARWNIQLGSSDPTLAARLAETLRSLAGSRRRLMVVAPLPEFKERVPDCMYRADVMQRGYENCGVAREIADLQRKHAMAILRDAMKGLVDVRLLDPFAAFCDRSVCLPYSNRRALFTDDDHMNAAGGRHLYDVFQSDLVRFAK